MFLPPARPEALGITLHRLEAFYMPETPLHNLLEICFDHYIHTSLAWDIITNAPNLKVLQMGLENDGWLSRTSIITYHDLRKLDLRAREQPRG